MEDKLLLARSSGIGIEFLGIFTRAQSAERHRLGFATLE